MAGWLAKEKDGKEVIFRHKPYRTVWDRWDDEKTYWVDDYNYNGTGHIVTSHPSTRIILPKGTIEKLIGRKLTWKDIPVKIK